MPPKIDVTVAAVIEQNNKFLVVEELVGGRHVFNQPAGHIEAGETLEQAVIRETLEETGCAFTPRHFLGVFSWCGESRSYLRIAFSGDVQPPAHAPSLDAGIVATHWLTRPQLVQRGSMMRSPMVLGCIERYDDGVHYPLSAVCEFIADLKDVAHIA